MDHSEVPMGFGMALMQNEKAVNAYAMMTKEEKNAILEQVRSARSKKEMQQIVSAIADDSIM